MFRLVTGTSKVRFLAGELGVFPSIPQKSFLEVERILGRRLAVSGRRLNGVIPFCVLSANKKASNLTSFLSSVNRSNSWPEVRFSEKAFIL